MTDGAPEAAFRAVVEAARNDPSRLGRVRALRDQALRGELAEDEFFGPDELTEYRRLIQSGR